MKFKQTADITIEKTIIGVSKDNEETYFDNLIYLAKALEIGESSNAQHYKTYYDEPSIPIAQSTLK